MTHAPRRIAVGLLILVQAFEPAVGVAQQDDTRATRPAVEEASPAIPAPQPGPLDPDQYRLGPGDELQLVIWGPISKSLPLLVGPEGEVFVPGAGSVRVAGLTLTEGRRRLGQLVASQYRNVRIEIQMLRVRTMVVYLTGEVRHPGPVIAQGSSRVVDVLPDSLFTDVASRRNVTVRHPDGSASIVDFQRFYRTGAVDSAGALRDGDVVHVPAAAARVGIWGGVATPQRYELGPRDSLLTLVRLAGGVTPAALPDSALLLHWTGGVRPESTWTSVGDVLSGRFNPPLGDGDNFYVYFDPEHRRNPQARIMGEVVRAGDYVIQEGETRFSDVVRAAGGFRPAADITAIELARPPITLRSDPEFDRLSRLPRESMTNTEYEIFRMKLLSLSPDFRLDWRRLENGPKSLDPVLRDGDIIQVSRLVNSVRVDGRVQHPGVYEFRAGEDAEYYIKLAGGYTNLASRGRVRVTRAVDGQSMQARNLKSLAPGDFVFVPEKPDITMWQQLATVIAVAANVATIVLVIRQAVYHP